MHHRSSREYRQDTRKRDRVVTEAESRKQADEEYYEIRSKVEAKIKQEEESKEEEFKRSKEESDEKPDIEKLHIKTEKNEHALNDDEPDSNHRDRDRDRGSHDRERDHGRDSNDRDHKDRDSHDRDHRDSHDREHRERESHSRDHSDREDQDQRERSGDHEHRGRSNDRHSHSRDRSREHERSYDERSENERGPSESREKESSEGLKSEMVKLEKQQSPEIDRKPFYNNAEQNNNGAQERKLFIVNSASAQNGGNWNNTQNTNQYEHATEFQNKYQMMANDPSNCKFYMKTGACRFGPRCSRNHVRYENTPTILIPNFFQDARLGMQSNDRNDEDYDEVELIHEFEKFYDDVIGEFRAAGTVVMFKCSQNYVPHLRGNVYVQYSKPEYALEALNMFNGRFYAGRQLEVELSPVTNWKSSICGLFDKRLCPRGKACNFLHVFRNPGNAYSVPNRTDFDPERAFRSGGYDPSFVNPNHPVFKYYNQRDAYGYRSENAKSSNMRNQVNKWDNDKNERSRSRSRSREKDRRRKHSHSRSHSRDSKSRSRSRSHSPRSRKRKHSKSKSRSSSRSRSKSRSKERKSRSRKHSHSSESSRGSNKKKKHTGNDSDVSDTSTDWSDISLDE